jgi:PAS domain-containing protein
MKPPYKGLSSYFKFFVAFTLLTIIILIDYYAFYNRSKRVELYSAIDARLNSIMLSSVSLQHNLGMLVLPGRFGGISISLIKKDVGRLDGNIAEVTEGADYLGIINENVFISEGLVSIADVWQAVRDEMANLNMVSTEEELRLIHDAVYNNTVFINEVSERLLALLRKSRAEVADDIMVQIVGSFVGFLVFLLAAFLIFYRRYLSPLWDVASTAERIALGGAGVGVEKFKGLGGHYVMRLSDSLNEMFAALTLKNALWSKRYKKVVEEGRIKGGQIEALGILNGLAGSMLSWADIFSKSVDEAVSKGGIDAAGIYILEGGSLKLKASAGFDGSVTGYGAPIQPPEPLAPGSGGIEIFGEDKEYPDAGYMALLKSCGFKGLLSVPISCDDRTGGHLHACFKDDGAAPLAIPFVKAMASNINGFAGYVDMLHGEQGLRRFLERVMNQIPLGVATFGPDGICRMVNTPFKRILGASPEVELVGGFNIFEDDVLIAQSMMPTIRKSYEGFVTEFIINYDPALLKKYKFDSSPRELKISSIPFYDPGGEISSIILLYEDLTDSPGPVGPASSPGAGRDGSDD